MGTSINYIAAYPEQLQQQVQKMVEDKTLGQFLLKKYPQPHKIANDNDLRQYVMSIKNTSLKKSDPLSKVIYDNKIHIINNALGLHSYVSRVQGGKLKSKNEIRISALFKKMPEPLLNMIVVHELAHLKEKEHNKAFYQLCTYMLSDYFQLEFDTRLFLMQIELSGTIYS